MFTNDIVGNTRGRTAPRRARVRLFSEGVPSDDTPDEPARVQAIGGENDAPARQLARFVKAEAENRATGMHVD